jgi:flap endonuclease-1
MHFSRIPYRNRHVLGWYRLVLDMKEAGVNAICVFDSTKGRPVAKQKEVTVPITWLIL